MSLFWVILAIFCFFIQWYYKDKIFVALFFATFATFVTTIVTENLALHIICFYLCFIVLSLYFKIVKKSPLLRRLKPTTFKDLVGKSVTVAQPIDPEKFHFGLIKLGGDTWAAKSINNTLFKKGDTAYIVAVKGLFVYISEQKKEEYHL